MTKKNKKSLINNLEKTRNTKKQLKWYGNFSKHINHLKIQKFDVAHSFPVYNTRQCVQRFLETYDFYKKIEKIPGSIVEMGVGKGSFLMAMAHICSINEGHHYTRKIYGFDTFKGFKSLSDEDKNSKANHMKTGGLNFDVFNDLKKIISFYDKNRQIGNVNKISLIKGDVMKTLPKFLSKNKHIVISMLHLDLDIFKPTKLALELLYEKVPKGGIIIFDELNHEDYPGETMAFDQVLGIKNYQIKRLPISPMASYIIKT
ncbi:TylF/MycF/NovP-related O-methyltransferase [Candidatus Pelagibacter sp. HIMB1509]|uniref:TylF/MycF/NovP-related O-methyltransferase n=1 Tax=Candidatus Pelagibacter sp. HIMB1509 TaxID=3413339 RepID=UPI003F857D14